MTSPAVNRPSAPETEAPQDVLAAGDPRLVFGLVGPAPGGSAGELASANACGALEAADIHVARTVARLGGERDSDVTSIIARLVAAARAGSSCVPLSQPQIRAMRNSRLCGDARRAAPIRLVDGVAYLDRYWRLERSVRDHVLTRMAAAMPVDTNAARASLWRRLPRPDQHEQRVAVAMALLRPLSVLAGGPGTGKTTTVAALVQVLRDVAPTPPHLAIAAPTGKAAARLQSTLDAELGRVDPTQRPQTGTVHSLLKMRPGRAPLFSARNPLPHEVVVVDETSMVSLPLLAHLLGAVRDTARLVLVGDPDQLASVDVGAVLADLVRRPAPAAASPDPRLAALLADPARGGKEKEPYDPADAARGVTRLRRGWRFTGDIANFAEAIRTGDVGAVSELLDRWQTGPRRWRNELAEGPDAAQQAGSDVRFWPYHAADPVRPGPDTLPALAESVATQAAAIRRAAQRGDAHAALAALDSHQLLTAHRLGPYGAQRWAELARRWAAQTLPGHGRVGAGGPHRYLGAAVVVTRNDPSTGLFNGDVGVLIADPDTGGGELVVAFAGAEQAIQRVRLGQLPEVLPVAAMTVHRAQGSQYDAVTVVLPEPESALLTRELLYTAVTRARRRVDVIADPAAVLAAVANPARRASGLRRADAWDVDRPDISAPMG